jgi:hypothetical protein
MVLFKLRVFCQSLLRDEAIDKVLWPYTYLFPLGLDYSIFNIAVLNIRLMEDCGLYGITNS